MADSLHRVQIQADVSQVYLALTTTQGVMGWWTDTCEVAAKEGGRCQFWFDDKSTCFSMCATRLLPNQRVFWQCTDGPQEWVNTELWWEITPIKEHTCLLDFKHMNWTSDEGMFPLCNTTWGHLMHRLKYWCETGQALPLFTNI